MADVTLLADLNIPGDLIIDVGTLYLNGFNLTVGDDLTINETLKVQGHEIITVSGVPITTSKLDVHPDVLLAPAWTLAFAGELEATVTKYATIFGNITLGSSKIHRFAAGLANEITINGVFGTSSTPLSPASLRSTSGGQEWYVNLVGSSDLVENVDIKDSNADSGLEIDANDSLDSGNNSNWKFAPVYNPVNSPLGNETWGDILFKIRTRLNEPEEAFFTDEQLMCYWNEVQLYFARETKFRKVDQVFEITTTSSTPTLQYILLPSDFLGVISCGLQSKDTALDLTWLRVTGLAGRSKQGFQDQAYYIANRSELRVVREVDATEVNIVLNFYASPVPFVDETDLTALSYVFDEYVEDVILGTVASALLQRGNFEEYDRLQNIFLMRVREAIKAEGRRTGHKQMTAMR